MTPRDAPGKAMDPKDLRNLIIEPRLHALGMYSESAVVLMLMTAAHESHLGEWLVERGGPACGIYQINPDTAQDVLGRYLVERRPDIAAKVRPPLGVDDLAALAAPDQVAELRRWLIGDLYFQTDVARIRYWMVPARLPDPDDLEGMAHYHKDHYNTALGAADPEQTLADYKRLVLGE